MSLATDEKLRQMVMTGLGQVKYSRRWRQQEMSNGRWLLDNITCLSAHKCRPGNL